MARHKRAVKVIRPNKPEARDEGPRLLPLREKVETQDTKLQHYMKLADLALSKRVAPKN
jgi:hypothetical protein